jgi:hypothetical protein
VKPITGPADQHEMVIARVLSAFSRQYHIRPTTCDRVAVLDDGQRYACAVGVVSIDAYPRGTRRRSLGMSDLFGPHTECVAMGWDDASDANVHSRLANLDDDLPCCPHCGVRQCDWYAAGAAAAVAMEIA